MSKIFRTTFAHLQQGAPFDEAAFNAAAFPQPQSTPARSLLDTVEGDQRFMHVWGPSGPAAIGKEMRPAPRAWQAAGVGSFDGMCWYAGASAGNNVHTVQPGAFLMDGTAGVGVDSVHATVPNGELNSGVIAGAWSDQLWVGGGVGYVNNAVHAGVRMGCLGSVRCHNSVDVTFPQYTRAEADALPGLPPGAKATVHVKEARFFQWVWIPAATLFNWVRLLVRADRISTRNGEYKGPVDEETAKALANQSTSRIGRWAVGTWRGLWNHHPLDVPPLEWPETLKDNASRSARFGRRGGWLATAGLNLFVGHQRGKAHESELQVQRNDKALSVTWTQSSTTSRRSFGTMATGVGFDWGTHTPVSKRVQFEMPRDDESALDAYRAFVNVLKGYHSAADEEAAFRKLEAFASNVVTTRSEGNSRSHEVGTRMPQFPGNLWSAVMPQGFSSGLMHNREQSHFEVNTTNASGDTTRLQVALAQRLRKLGPDGRRLNSIVAVIETGTRDEKALQPSVIVGGHFAFSRVDASEVQRLAVNPLNNHLGTALAMGALQAAGWRTSREVDIERRITWAEMAQLAALSHMGESNQVDAVRAASGVDAQAWDRLCATMRALRLGPDDSHARVIQGCEAVQRFVETTGLPGIGALRQALALDVSGTDAREENARWVLSTESSGYDVVADESGFSGLRAALYNAQSVSVRAGKALESKRRKLEADVALAAQLLDQDPFLSASDKATMGQSVSRRRAELQAMKQHIEALTL